MFASHLYLDATFDDNLNDATMFQAAEVESQVRLLDETLASTGDERIRPSCKSNVDEQLLPAAGFYQQVAGIQFARWNPFDGMTPAPHMNGGPGVLNPIGQQGSTEPNHACSQGRSKRACSPGSEAVWEEEKKEKEKRNGWKCEEEQRNGWPPQFTSLANNNGDPPASDHRPSNGGNILMVSY